MVAWLGYELKCEGSSNLGVLLGVHVFPAVGLWILRSEKVFMAKPVHPQYTGAVAIETNSLWFILPGSALQLGMKEGSEPEGIVFIAVCLLLAHLVCMSQTQTDPVFHSCVIHVEMLNNSTEHAKTNKQTNKSNRSPPPFYRRKQGWALFT